ncbi:MAG TPA: ATP-binding protein [Candidatus Limnocylindrales bacterium]|nr:ATP-binding protein [Candidatus Limnocylindrales bacterium]
MVEFLKKLRVKLIQFLRKIYRTLCHIQATIESWRIADIWQVVKQGVKLWINLSRLLLRDQSGRLNVLSKGAQDLTLRRRTQSLLAGQKRVLEMIAMGAPLPRVLEALTRTIEQQSPELFCSILLLDEEGKHLRLMAAPNLPEEFNTAIDGITMDAGSNGFNAAIRRKGLVIVSDISTDPLWVDFRDLALRYGLRACWSVPIFSRSNEVLGTFALYYQESRSPNPYDLELIETAAHLAGIVIELKRAEEALAKEKEYLAVTLRSIGDGVITTDTEGRVALINEVAEKLTGWTQEASKGKPLAEVFYLVHEKNRQTVENPVKKILEVGGTTILPNHLVLMAKDGTERLIAGSGTPIRDKNGKVIGAVLVFQDITEKRKIEEERIRANNLESLALLAGGIAHDFNNILAAITVNISLAKLSVAPETEMFKRLTEAEKASLRARNLTQQLLTFSKGGEPIKRITSLTELIKDTAGFALGGSKIRCELSIPGNLWPAEVDEGQISQVIHNLILNARQAMPKGGIIKIRGENITIGSEKIQPGWPLQPGKYIKISVEDQGIGIPDEHLPKIFDPYFTTKRKGTGLGLATTYSIIKRHEGYIHVESKLGVGTIFTLYLPASQKETEIQEDAIQVETLIHPKGDKGRILIMDDEEIVREANRRMLNYLGYDVEFAKEGTEAIELYQKTKESGKPFDVVILDLTIPGGLGGHETIQKLLEINPQVKAILSSGYLDDPIMADFRKWGFKGVIPKPYKVEELDRILQKVLSSDQTS